MSSRAKELASSLVRTQMRFRAAEKAVERHAAKHKTSDVRTIKNHQKLLADVLLAKNDLTVIERMLKAEVGRDAF
jgi:hypothetical protein